jgi:hypothetical protein
MATSHEAYVDTSALIASMDASDSHRALFAGLFAGRPEGDGRCHGNIETVEASDVAALAYAIYDIGIMRTIVDLTDEQVKSLAALCAARGISRAEAVRRAVTRLLAEEHRPERLRAFGAWAGKAGDAVETVRRLRDEWER